MKHPSVWTHTAAKLRSIDLTIHGLSHTHRVITGTVARFIPRYSPIPEGRLEIRVIEKHSRDHSRCHSRETSIFFGK